MNKRLKNQILSSILMVMFTFGFIIPDMKTVYANMLTYLPEGFSSIAIGSNAEGNAYYDNNTKQFNIEGTGGYVGKDKGATDSYQFVSYKVEGDATIVARLADFDMSSATSGQAGVFIRSTNNTDNADYFGVYVEPSLDGYRYAYRDVSDANSEKGGTGAETIEGITSNDKNLYIKLVKKRNDFKYFISDDVTFPADKTLMKGQEIISDNDEWYVGFAVSNGESDSNTIANFDNISITDATGLVFDSNTFTTPVDRGILPEGFVNSSIGNENNTSYANFDKENKNFTIEGSGNLIGKDNGVTDNYQFVNYEVEGDATITARLVDFDMSNAPKGQAGVFIRDNNTANDAQYFGAYVDSGANQYRYAFRDNVKAGAAAINGLDMNSKNKYIKIVKEGNVFRYFISEDPTFPANNTITNSQNVSMEDDGVWNVGLVVSNGGSTTPAVAIFDNVKIETADKVYYDSTLEVMPVDTVEGVEAVAGDSNVALSWNNVESATSYIVKRATAIDGQYEEIATVSGNTYVDNTVTNNTTYYYVLVAANDEGISHDSKVVSAMPNNSNPLNLQYGKDAAKFTITEKPNDTVFDSVIKIAGYTDKDGTITIEQNGKVLVDSEVKAANESFEQVLNLKLGRNTINIYQTTEDGKKTLKSFNIVRLSKENVNMIVDSNYSGNDGDTVEGIKTYKTISAAVNAVSTKNEERVVIFVKNGIYKEKTIVQSPYISIIGEDSENTVWTYDAANGTINPETGKAYGTSGSASVTVKSKAIGFTAENITIANEFKEQGNNNEQAVALNNQADQSIFINVRLIGNQDTLLADASSSVPARQYYYKNYIEGDVDFIFGRAQAVFNDCEIVSLNRNSTSNNGYVTAADTWDKDAYGYLIINSRLLGEEGIADNTVSLGRPWRPSSQTQKMTPTVTYVNNYMGSHITAKGWEDMGADSLAVDSRFFEFGNFGLGAKLSETRNQLTVEEVKNYEMNNVFAKNSATTNGNDAFTFDWIPTSVEAKVNIETLYGIFIPVTSIALEEKEATLKVGETSTINALVGPENASEKTITFKTNDENVAIVDENGVVTAVAVGTTTITVSAGDISEEYSVTVLPSLTVMNKVPVITADDVTIKVGDNFGAMEAVTANDKEDGDITSNIEVVENTVDTAKAGEYKVVYKVTDSQGASATKEIKVTVLPILVGMNSVPKIVAKDITIKVGDNFDVMEDVTANDKEDGNITSNIEVVENTVDTSKAGEYRVVYKVSDSQGASVTKEIKVTVEVVDEVVEDNNNGNSNGNAADDESVDDSVNGSTDNVGGNTTENNSNNLPNTGGTFAVAVGVIALLLIIAGVFLFRKKDRK